jgi:hypothetical protein
MGDGGDELTTLHWNIFLVFDFVLLWRELFCIQYLYFEEPDGPTVSALRRAIAEVKQRWSVIGWLTKNL